MKTARVWQVGFMAALIATTCSCTAPQSVRVTQHEIPWPNVDLVRPIRVVQLSDLHIGTTTPDPLLELAVRQVTAAQPDLVVITGDFLNYDLKYLYKLNEFVSKLPRPCLAVMGNHDRWAGRLEIEATLETAGVHVLHDQYEVLALADQNLEVVGFDEKSTIETIQKVFSVLPSPQEALVLTHSPKGADQMAKVGGRLILVGHTHGGQIDLPGVTDFVGELLGLPYLFGLHPLNDATWLYVNAGVGSAGIKSRVGEKAQPEVAIFDLVNDP